MNVDLFFAKMSFSGKQKARILRQIQRLVKSNIALAKTLDMLYDLYSKGGKKPKDPMAVAIAHWRRKYQGGQSFSSCLSGWVSPSEELIIQAGEQSDGLAKAFSDALEGTAAAKKIRKAIIGGLAYPAVLLFALVAMLYGFSNSIIPTFATIVPPERWTGNAATMYAISQFVINWIPVLLMALAGLGTVVFLSLARYTGSLRPVLDKFPPYSIYKVIAGASFMISMRGFIMAKIPIPEALRRIQKVGSPYVRHRSKAILSGVDLGLNLGQAMMRTGHNFPDPDINGEISIYSGLEGFADSLDILAKEWIEESVDRAQSTSKVMGNIMLTLLALTIGFMAMSMFELQDIITQSAQSGR